MVIQVHLNVTLNLCLHTQAYRENNFSMVWNVKVTQGQNLKTCGTSLENYIDTVSFAVCFPFTAIIQVQFTQNK